MAKPSQDILRSVFFQNAARILSLRFVRILIFIFVPLSQLPTLGHAIVRNWIGSGPWSSASNWSPAGVPSAGDTASFGPSGLNCLMDLPASGVLITVTSGFTSAITLTAATSPASFTMAGGTLYTSSSNMMITGSYTQTGGSLVMNGLGTTLGVGSNFQQSGGSISPGINTIALNGGGSLSALAGLYNLTINCSSATVSLGSNVTAAGTLTLSGAGAILSLGTNSLFVTGAVNVGAGSTLQAGNGPGLQTGAGGGMFVNGSYMGGSASSNINGGLTLNPGASFVGSSGSWTLGTTGTFTVNAGSSFNNPGILNMGASNMYTTGVNLGNVIFTSANAGTFQTGVTVNNVTFNAGTTGGGGGTLTVMGNWYVNNGGGAVFSGTGSVIFAGTNQSIAGTSTFLNFSKSVSSPVALTLAFGVTQTVTGSLTLQGSAGNLLSLRSSVANNLAGLNVTGSSYVRYVNVKDSVALVAMTDLDGVNSGNTQNWTFLVSTPTITSTQTPSPSFTVTPSVTPTSTSTPTDTASVTPSFSVTLTDSPTPTQTLTQSPTMSFTSSATLSDSPSPSVTLSSSTTSSVTLTDSPSPTATVTNSPTPSVSLSPSPSSSVTLSDSPTPSITLTSSLTVTGTATATPSVTSTATPTSTFSSTSSPSGTATVSLTETLSTTSSPTNTGSPTPTASLSPSGSATASATPSTSPSMTCSKSPSVTLTDTLPATVTSTGTLTQTPTATLSWTASDTPTPQLPVLNGPVQTGANVNYAFSGTAFPGSTVVIVDQTFSQTLGSGSVGPNGTFVIVATANISGASAIKAHLNSAGGPAGNALIPVNPPATLSVGTNALDAGATVLTANGSPGLAVVVVDLTNNMVLGQSTFDSSGQAAVFLNPPTTASHSLGLVVASRLDRTIAVSGVAGQPASLDPGFVLVEGTVLTGKGNPGAQIQLVDGNGSVLGTTLVGPQGTFSLAVNGAQVGASLKLLQNGVARDLALTPQRLGAERAFLSTNIFRPISGASLNIGFKAPADERVTITIFNMLGERVRHLADFSAKSGIVYALSWDGHNGESETVAAGIYFISIKGDQTHLLKKVVVLK